MTSTPTVRGVGGGNPSPFFWATPNGWCGVGALLPSFGWCGVSYYANHTPNPQIEGAAHLLRSETPL